jgi:hypothetical protein
MPACVRDGVMTLVFALVVGQHDRCRWSSGACSSTLPTALSALLRLSLQQHMHVLALSLQTEIARGMSEMSVKELVDTIDPES